MDQMFAVWQMSEKFWAKGKEEFYCFMNLEKAYDRIDRYSFWDVL